MTKRKQREERTSEVPQNISCPECGSNNIKTVDEEHSFPYGTGEEATTLSAKVPIRVCCDCGFRFMDLGAEQGCHEAICRHLGVMNPSQVKALRNLHGLTQSEFSGITGLGLATISRWERGALIQNLAYDNYLYLLGFKENLDHIRERMAVPKTEEKVAPVSPRASFREIEITEELLMRKNSFKIRPE